jgi:hypothetical protein
MKKFKLLGISMAIMLIGYAGYAQNQKKVTTVATTNNVVAYYFHNTSRCTTCKTVEAETKADLESLYHGQVSFKALNLEEDANKVIVEKLKVSGQTLLIVKGDQKVNLTNEGFMYAVTNPAKFKSIIKAKVDKLLE